MPAYAACWAIAALVVARWSAALSQGWLEQPL